MAGPISKKWDRVLVGNEVDFGLEISGENGLHRTDVKRTSADGDTPRIQSQVRKLDRGIWLISLES